MTSKERFKANIRMFEIEPHSYCNRKCWFCPNSNIDRTGPVKFMDHNLYLQILADLGSIDYAEAVCFAGWCEPFSQPSFLVRVKEAWDFLPCALLMANTNTDYLSTEVVHDAAAAGLSVLKAQLYFGRDEPFCDEAVWVKMENLRRRLPGIDFRQRADAPGKWFAYVDSKLVIVAYAKDFRKVGHNRCDTIIRKPQKRWHTCGEAITMFGVNHNGWAVPCCNIRSDYPPHKGVLLGKMNATPGKMFELYQGVLLQEDQYPCTECMGKQWHANHKIVFEEVFRELDKWQTQMQQP
jgi:hypothetical protein